VQFKIFTIPVADDGAAMEEMNRFLRGHKVLEVEQQLLSTKTGANWHFCVKYIANALPSSAGKTGGGESQSKKDYKEILDEKTFARFSVLREVRKKLAEEDGLPVYAVFTNEELAAIAALDEINAQTLKTVNGVGEKKTEKYVARMTEYLQKMITE
jgi:superfamily II DNA helicase RecQ